VVRPGEAFWVCGQQCCCNAMHPLQLVGHGQWLSDFCVSELLMYAAMHMPSANGCDCMLGERLTTLV
jgi:hypothetical protein